MTLALSIAETVSRSGRSVTLRRTSSDGGTYVASTDTYTPPATPASYTLKALVLNYSDRQIDGERRRAGDRRYVIADAPATIGFTPQAGDSVLDGGETWQVVGIDRIVRYGEDRVAMTLQARR